MDTDVVQKPALKSRLHSYIVGLLLFLVGGFLVIIGFIYSQQQVDQSETNLTLAPDFSFMTFDGRYFHLSDFRGDVVVLNFWASWCGPCRIEAPAFQTAWEQFGSQEDIHFIGLAYNDTLEDSKAFLAEYGITFINGPDLGHEIVDLFGVNSIPTTIIINREGYVVDYLYARQTLDTLMEHIQKQL